MKKLVRSCITYTLFERYLCGLDKANSLGKKDYVNFLEKTKNSSVRCYRVPRSASSLWATDLPPDLLQVISSATQNVEDAPRVGHSFAQGTSQSPACLDQGCSQARINHLICELTGATQYQQALSTHIHFLFSLFDIYMSRCIFTKKLLNKFGCPTKSITK